MPDAVFDCLLVRTAQFTFGSGSIARRMRLCLGVVTVAFCTGGHQVAACAVQDPWNDLSKLFASEIPLFPKWGLKSPQQSL